MIRPAVRAALARWAEAALAAALLATGLWLAAAATGLPALLGTTLALIGAVMLPRGLRLARAFDEAEAPGLVEVVEGRVGYFGPVTGGVADIDALSEVSLRRTSDGAAWWRLSAPPAPPLLIPAGARGAHLLIDALAPLPGWSADRAAAALRQRRRGVRVLWRRDPAPALPRP